MSITDYEWRGVHRVRPDYPPYIVERYPYNECPRCERFQYRPMYDGRTEESYGLCKNCRYRDDDVLATPDRYVHDANKSSADCLLVVFGLMLLVTFAWGLLKLFGLL